MVHAKFMLIVTISLIKFRTSIIYKALQVSLQYNTLAAVELLGSFVVGTENDRCVLNKTLAFY